MRLRFQWDSLRRDDHVLVRSAAAPDLGLRPTVAVLANPPGSRRDIAVRDTDGVENGQVVRPGRVATHPDPCTDAAECWRRAETRAA